MAFCVRQAPSRLWVYSTGLPWYYPDRPWGQILPHLCPAPFWSHCRILRFSGKKTLPDFQVSEFCFIAIWNQLSPSQSWKNHLVQTVKHSQRAVAVIPGRWSSARLALCSLFLGNYKTQKSLRTWLGPGVRRAFGIRARILAGQENG